MVLGLLAGNTSLRYGLFEAGAIAEWGRIEWGELEGQGPRLEGLISRHPVSRCVAGSVRDDLLEQARAWLPGGLWPPRLARRDFPIPIENRYDRPDEVGTDRLLNSLAARDLAVGRATVTVDFGTAVSISVTSRDGAFVGGVIAAGGKAVAGGLKLAAPRLPLVEPAALSGTIQRNTSRAVQCGVYWQVAGAVRTIVQRILGELGAGAPVGLAPPRVFATGGEALVFSSSVPEIEEVVPDLTLRGLCIASSLSE